MAIDLRDQTPFHSQIRKLVLHRIETGNWQPSERLPSDEAFACQLGLHRHTVRQALAALAQEGYLVRHRGRGTFVAERPVRHHLGLLLGVDVHHLHASAFSTLLVNYAHEYFQERNSGVKLYLVPRWLGQRHGARNEDLVRDIQQHALRACLVACGAQFDAADTFELLLRHRIPFVMGTALPTHYPSFGFDFEGMVTQGMDYLHARGRRRIAIVYGHHSEVPIHAEEESFFTSYRRCVARLGLEWRREWVKNEGEPGQEAGYHAMKELWLLGAARPDAVLSCDDVVTQGIIHAWWELGIQAPRDLGFITHANKSAPLLYPVPLTQLECDTEELVSLAGQMLLTLAEGKALPRPREMAGVKLIPGMSCGENEQQQVKPQA